MQINSGNLHNAFGAAVETGDVQVAAQLAHFLVHSHIDINVRVLRILFQERFDAELQVLVGAARRHAHRPVDVGKARCPMTTLWERTETRACYQQV